MKKILITGAGGFLGGFLVSKSLDSGFETYAGVRHSTNLEYLKDARTNIIHLTFKHKDKLREEIKTFKREHGKWDYIIHNLGVTKTSDVKVFDKINFDYLKNFVEILIETDCIPEKFVYMSSLSAWADDGKSMGPIAETESPYPNTAYGMSKLRSEIFLRSCKGFPFVALRPTGIYGPREKDYFVMINLIRKGIDLSVGNTPKKLTFLYVKDLVKAAFLALEKGVNGKGYFLTDGKEYSQKEFKNITAASLGKKIVISIVVPVAICRFVCEMAEDIATNRGKTSLLNRDKFKILKQSNWSCDTTEAEKDLGFYADYDLKKGIGETVKWYKDNGWF